MNDGIFAGYTGDFFGKSKRIFICKSGGLQLWISLHLLEAHMNSWRRDSDEYRALEMKTLREFPYEPDPTCRCRDCRYIRMTRRWDNL